MQENLAASQPWWPGQCEAAASEVAVSSQLGEAGWLGHEAGRAQAGWSSAGLTLKATRGVRHREKLAMLLWVPQALLALLLPTLLAQGEGKETVGKHAGPGWQLQRWERGCLAPPKVEGKRVLEWVGLQASWGSYYI